MGELVRAPAQQGRCGQQAQAVGVGRIGEGIEKALQGRGTRAFEHIPLAHEPAGDAHVLKGLAQGFGLAMGAHQQAEIPRREGMALLAPLQHEPPAEELGAVGGNLLGQGLLQHAPARGLGACGPGSTQPEQLEGMLIGIEVQRPFGGLGLHRRHRQLGSPQPGGHQPVQGLDQARG